MAELCHRQGPLLSEGGSGGNPKKPEVLSAGFF
jgi:hypothetical protein